MNKENQSQNVREAEKDKEESKREKLKVIESLNFSTVT